MSEQKDLVAAREQSIQARARGQALTPSLLMWLSNAGQLISPWWSKTRDSQIRKFWKTVDHLSGSIYSMQSRISTIPFRIEPADSAISSQVKTAEFFQGILEDEAEYGEGWNAFVEPFIEDILTQDNGGMAEIIGGGRPDGPIIGPALGIAHLDSWACQRTGNPEFPIVYHDTDGKMYKLHWTRVIYVASLPSANVRMNNVGFCAVSRCLNIAQNFLDMLIYKQEKLGSRPHRGIMVTKGGLDPEDIRAAFALAAEMQDNQRLSRFSKMVVVGDGGIPEAEIDLVDMASLPDGFDERESTDIGMALIALAMGVDARELWPATQRGATRADALISHIKQRGKGIGQILQILTRQLGNKFLPANMSLVFDWQDDAQDRQRAEIRKTRADRRTADLAIAVTDERTEREDMLNTGEITRAQFIRLELKDGRLEDGTSVLTLFFKDEFSDLLDLGIEEPLNTIANDKEEVLEAIVVARNAVIESVGTTGVARRIREGEMAIGALDELERLYTEGGGIDPEEEIPDETEELMPADETRVDPAAGDEGTGTPKPPDGRDLEIDEEEEKSNGRVVATAIASFRAMTHVLSEAKRAND